MNSAALMVSGIGKRNALLRLIKSECAVRGVALIGCDALDTPPARVEVDRFHRLPFANDPDFSTAVLEVISEEKPLAHLTLIDMEIPVLGSLDGSSGGYTSRLLHPPADTALLCEDKYAFYQFLAARGLPVIETYLAPLTTLPFIRKDRRGSAASGFKVFRTKEDLATVGVDDGNPKFIFQPYCEGRHICIDAYYALDDGRLIDCCAKEVLFKKGGESFLLRSMEREPFEALLHRVAAEIRLSGIVNFDLYVEDGEIKIMEINCRIGGNYPASHAFGCDLLELSLADAMGELTKDRSPSAYAIGAHCAKYIGFTEPY